MTTDSYIVFSKPFIEALKETFKVMMNADLKPHSPRIKPNTLARGEVTALIGMNGTLQKNGKENEFNGLIAISFEKEIYLKIAGAMLMQEFTDYCPDVEDVGAEIANIVMGNAKKTLATQGYKIGMSSPTRIKGKNIDIKYPGNTTVIETMMTTPWGDFSFDICYREF